MDFKVIGKFIGNEKRFIIVDKNDKLLDDAQGYGYLAQKKCK